ncbi:MAG: MBOAT family protein [Bacteroidales bacterium]|nr:MBOAT family protein [Bacteroidales bacterium]
MVFSSNVFLLYFMPVFFLLYFIMPKKGRNYVLLFASLLFYAWGAPEFIIQLIVSVIATFYLVRWMHRTDKPKLKKWLCGISIFIPIGLLLFYKYGNFTMENLNFAREFFGKAPYEWKRILLPIGISFFSFQSVTYTLDTYRGVNKPMERLSDFMLYITMFPQLIAGPIVRYCDVADQIRNRESSYANRLQGFYRFVIGLCKKVLIADVIGAQVDAVLNAADFATTLTTLNTGTAWLVALAYTFQIYFDFAGYSDMAIGLGRIMGFKFPENFDNPYTSHSITEFWRRWHKTLGAFILNYLYIPLGGNRKGKGRMYLNLWVCFLLSGLWHGASWNFVVWGALHGFFICLDKLLNRKRKFFYSPFSVLLTFIIVNLLWVFFRIENISEAWTFITRMFAFDFATPYVDVNLQFYVTLAVAAVFSFITLFPFGKKLQEKVYYTDYSNKGHIIVWIVAIVLFIFSLAALNASGFSPFIYFRF